MEKSKKETVHRMKLTIRIRINLVSVYKQKSTIPHPVFDRCRIALSYNLSFKTIIPTELN